MHADGVLDPSDEYFELQHDQLRLQCAQVHDCMYKMLDDLVRRKLRMEMYCVSEIVWTIARGACL